MLDVMLIKKQDTLPAFNEITVSHSFQSKLLLHSILLDLNAHLHLLEKSNNFTCQDYSECTVYHPLHKHSFSDLCYLNI